MIEPHAVKSGQRHHGEAGLSMIEVLVTLIIVSVGLLGLAALQNVSLKNTYSSHLMTTANNLAYDIADRMRAQRQAATGGQYNIKFGNTPNLKKNNPSLARKELQAWLNTVQEDLPDGEAEIAVRNDGTAVIRLRWLDNRPQLQAGGGGGSGSGGAGSGSNNSGGNNSGSNNSGGNNSGGNNSGGSGNKKTTVTIRTQI